LTSENDDTSQRACNPSRLSRLAKIDKERDYTMTEDQPTRYLVIINDGPYGNERPYNGLCLAMSLTKRETVHVRVFLMGDGVQCAVKGQETPQGYYNIERMLTAVLRGGEVAT